MFNFPSAPAEEGASNNLEPQQATLEGHGDQNHAPEDELTTQELIKKALKARDRLNLQFARHSINSSNREVLITLAETAIVLDNMARLLAEKQIHVEL